MKRTGLTILLVMFLVLGCLIVSGAALANDTINVLYVFDQPWKDQAARFTEATGINVNYIEIPFGDQRDRHLASFMGGQSEYDVIHIRDDWAAEYASRGFLTPLSQFVEDGDLDGQTDFALANLSWEDELYGLPRYVWLWQFYYNTEILAAAGWDNPPANWDEVIQAGRDIKEAGYGAMAEAWGTYHQVYGFYTRLLSEGGEFLDSFGNPKFNSEAGIRALENMRTLFEEGIIGPESLEFTGTGPTADVFVQGRHGMALNTPHLYPMSFNEEISRAAGKIEVGVVPFGQAGSGSWAETGGVGIPASSQRKELAWEYIKFVTSPEEQKIIAMELGRIPTRPAVLNDPEVQGKYSHFAVVADQLQHPYGMAKSPHAQEIVDTLSEYIVLTIQGRLDPAQALQLAEEEVLSIIR